ncbi:MAG: TonB family protein [Deltaproteobacteria bacterium]|nr:TonB family protein [Deltaproteobacteria bacterium]
MPGFFSMLSFFRRVPDIFGSAASTKRFSAWAPLCGFLVLAVFLAAAPARAQLEPQPTDFSEEPEAPKPKKLTKMPELLEQSEPTLPSDAPEAGIAGEVVVRISLDAEGGVTRVEVLQSGGEILDWATLGATLSFAFSPAEFDGEPGPVALDWKQVYVLNEIVEVVDTDETKRADAAAGVGQKKQGPVNFEGVVRESVSKVPLPSVEVTVMVEHPPESEKFKLFEDGIESISTLSDEEGRFYFRGVPEGRYKVSFGLTGYDVAFIVDDFYTDRRTEAIVYLVPLDANNFETVIRERRARKEVAKVKLTREEVRKIPGTFGDPVRVVENLPGMARAPGFGGALIVRGANPSDTGIYFDGVEIPLLYHFGGLTSVVNAEFLDDISFYPGGFSGYYGRATAGIVDVSSRELNMRNFKGYVEVDLLDSGFFFGGPVKLGNLPKFTFAAAARRSYLDALMPIAMDIFVPAGSQGVVATPIYWDYQLKVESDLLPGHHVSLFAFGSDDDLKVVVSGLGAGREVSLGTHQGFHRFVGRWDIDFGGGLRHRFSPYIGLSFLDVGINAGGGINANIGATTYNWGLRDELRYAPNDIFEIAAGIDYQGNNYGFDVNVPLPLEINSFPRVTPRISGQNISFQSSGLFNSAGLYLEGVFSPFEWMKIVPSLRSEFTMITALPDELEDGTAIDGDNIFLWSVDPRVSARFDVLKTTTLKGAVGYYRQPPSNREVFPETGNPFLENPRALQIIGGIEQELTEFINIDMQLYYTHRDRMVQSTSESIPSGDGTFDQVFFNNEGYGRTLGMELLLRHELSEYFFGWVAYTLSRSEIDTSEGHDGLVLTSFDQTHILTVVGQVNLPYNFTLGGRFRVVSGNPSTVPVGSVHDLDTTNYGQLPNNYRSSRLPAFHQLDIRVDRKWVFDDFSFTTYLDLLNAYNAENAEAYQDDYRFREREPVPSLPIIPVIGASGEF